MPLPLLFVSFFFVFCKRLGERKRKLELPLRRLKVAILKWPIPRNRPFFRRIGHFWVIKIRGIDRYFTSNLACFKSLPSQYVLFCIGQSESKEWIECGKQVSQHTSFTDFLSCDVFSHHLLPVFWMPSCVISSYYSAVLGPLHKGLSINNVFIF